MVTDILSMHIDIQLAKRIDSTLRGPLGQEIEAMLEVMNPKTVAVIVPAFPSSGRTSIRGSVYVNGVPVHQTEAGHDPYTPVMTSDVIELLRGQTTLPIWLIETQRFQSNRDLFDEMKKALASGAKLIVCDACTDEEIQRLAGAWATIGVPLLPVDPGPFTAAYVSARVAKNKCILVVSGSVMDTARAQLDVLQESLPCGMVSLDLNRLCDPHESDAYREEIERQISGYLSCYQVVGIRSDRVPITRPLVGASITSTIANLVTRILAMHDFDGLYLSGGEVAYYTLREMEVVALQVVEEIVPLCVLSQIIGGPYDGLRVITKGGAVGDQTAILKSVQSLLYRIQS